MASQLLTANGSGSLAVKIDDSPQPKIQDDPSKIDGSLERPENSRSLVKSKSSDLITEKSAPVPWWLIASSVAIFVLAPAAWLKLRKSKPLPEDGRSGPPSIPLVAGNVSCGSCGNMCPLISHGASARRIHLRESRHFGKVSAVASRRMRLYLQFPRGNRCQIPPRVCSAPSHLLAPPP